MHGGEVRRSALFVIVGLLVTVPSFAVQTGSASSVIPCPHSADGFGAVRSVERSSPLPLNPCPGQEWAKAYGGAVGDEFNAIVQTPDGGYIAAGKTASFGGGEYENVWIVKLSDMGDVQWQRTYGGSTADEANAVLPTSDGGYVVAGETYSFGAGLWDVWVLKLDAIGGVLWQKAYGGSGSDRAYALVQTADGGYLIGGYTSSFGAGGNDLWVLKLDPSGNALWQRSVGSGNNEYLFWSGMTLALDGGVVLAARVDAGSSTYGLVVKLDANGDVLWSRTIGTSNTFFRAVLGTADGGYIVAGIRTSILVMKLDGAGNILWQKTYKGQFAVAIAAASDGGYVVLGRLLTDAKAGAGGTDFVLIRIDASGNALWDKTYGGANLEEPRAVWATSEGGYIAAGYTYSFGVGGAPPNDAWLVKTAPNGSLVTTCPSGIAVGISAAASNSRLSANAAAIYSATTAASVGDTSVGPVDSAATTATQCTA